jgi:hypothetical protein
VKFLIFPTPGTQIILKGKNNMTDLKNKLGELPPIFGRKAVENLLPGIITSKTLSNLHSMGKGPAFYKIGRRAFYERESFIDWLLASSRWIKSDI